MSRLTIHNPANDAHFMRIKPVRGTVRVSRGSTLLAESRDAVWVLENGRDVYDPVIYIPQGDVTGPLEPVPAKSTHCPLKGDASYLALNGEEVAWTYDRPLDFSEELRGFIAFDAARVTTEVSGTDALL